MSGQGGGEKTEKQTTGAWGEEQAAVFLLARGYAIVERNYRVKQGEIDIVAWHVKPYGGDTLCFIEVKTRKDEPGTAERATTQSKVLRVKRAAMHYCLTHDIAIDRTPIQFEQVSVYRCRGSEEPVCHWYVIPVE